MIRWQGYEVVETRKKVNCNRENEVGASSTVTACMMTVLRCYGTLDVCLGKAKMLRDADKAQIWEYKDVVA